MGKAAQAGFVDSAVATNTTQHVLKRPPLRHVVVHIISGHQGHLDVLAKSGQLVKMAVIVAIASILYLLLVEYFGGGL